MKTEEELLAAKKAYNKTYYERNKARLQELNRQNNIIYYNNNKARINEERRIRKALTGK